MASHSPAPPAPLHDDDIPGFPGWKRKLEPHKGRGLTPNKLDVIYVTPDGEEIKTKTHLQRYLKAHPGGPALSEFNWSTGETPRRSSRLTSKTPVDTTEAQITPKRGKRNVVQISQEEKDKEQDATSPPSKRAKKKGKETTLDDKVVGDSAAVAGVEEEIMQDVEKNENIVSVGEGIVEVTAANGELDMQGKAEEELTEVQENAMDKSVEVEKIEKASGEQETQPEEMIVEDNVVDVPVPVSLPAQKTDEVPERMTMQIPDAPDDIKDKHLENGSAECEQGEPLEPRSSKSVEFIVEAPNSPQVQDAIEFEKEVIERIPEEGLLKKDQETVSGGDSHHAGNSCFSGDAQDKSASQEVYHSSQPVGVTN